MIKVGQCQNKKKIKIFVSDTLFGALFLSLRVGNYMWKLCHLINKAFFFTLHILLYRIPTKLERYERWKFVYFLKRVCNRPLNCEKKETSLYMSKITPLGQFTLFKLRTGPQHVKWSLATQKYQPMKIRGFLQWLLWLVVGPQSIFTEWPSIVDKYFSVGKHRHRSIKKIYI